MQNRKIDCHHYGLPAMWGLENAIRMPLDFPHCTHSHVLATFFRPNRVPIRSNRVIFATKIFCEIGGAPKHCKVFKISLLGRSSRVENGRGMQRVFTTPDARLYYIK